MTEQQAHFLLIYMALIAFALLIAALVLIVVAVAITKVLKEMMTLTHEAKGKVYPLLDRVEGIAAKTEQIAKSTESIIADVQPKIERITTNLAESTDVYRAKVAEVDALVSDTTSKARRQTERVDDMLSTALSRTGEMAASVHNAILAPVRQMSGFVNGAKAGIDTLIHQFAPKPREKTPKPVAFEGKSVYTGHEDDYHA